MWTRKLLKENALIAFKRNYWTCVFVAVIAGILGASAPGASFNLNWNSNTEAASEAGVLSATSIPSYLIYVLGAAAMIAVVVGLAMSILLANVVKIGCNRYFLENREHKTSAGQLFFGFREGRYGSNVYIMFRKDLSVFLHALLLLVPGIIKAYQYFLVPYILAENPDLNREDVFELSKAMMKGNKRKLFVLELSFIGWAAVNTLTFGILGVFWLSPYIHATIAEFYTAVKAEAFAKGIASSVELPGVYYQEQTVEC